MKKTEIMNNITRTLNKAAFKFKKHSPEILVVAGVVGVVGSTVMACKATTKVNDILDDTKDQLDKIHEAGEKLVNGETLILKDGNEYTIEQNKKDLTIVYAQTALKFAKLYGPAVIIGGLSITAILAGHNITRKRNIALAAAYTAVDKSFKEYRGRVVERFGEALDKELKYGIKSKEVDEVVTNEDGTESVVKKTVNVVDATNPMNVSEYARFFDDGCAGWTKDPEYNLMFLRDQQRYANDLLKSKGHLFLNEVYDLLGIPRTKAGQIVGWIYDEKHPNGDNFVDFGIYDTNKTANRDFVNGYERTILLDFNVDGNIWDQM
jgi:hypothetical protein